MDKNGHQESNAPTLTLSTLQKFHTEGVYWDVQLRIGREVFKCQRFLLAAISEYFDTMFKSNFKESNTNRDEPITLHEIDATAFREIYDFIFTDEVCVTDSNVDRLLFTSDFLRLRSSRIEEQCVKHVQCRCQEEQPMPNAIRLFSFAYVNRKSILIDSLSAHISQHLRHYSKDPKLMEISFEILNKLLMCSKKYILSLPGTENVLVEIILNWVNQSRAERSEHRQELMGNINSANISSKFFRELVNTLENCADEMADLRPGDISSHYWELKMLEIERQSELNDDDSRPEGIITFVMKNFSRKRMNKLLYSAPVVISNLAWRIHVCREPGGNLSFYLNSDGPSGEVREWNCYATADLTITSQRKEVKGIAKRFSFCRFSSETLSRGGFAEFSKWDYVADQENGCIKDDCVTFQAHVFAEVPFS